jgi:acylphosphatase
VKEPGTAAFRARVIGRVQGVGFRYSAVRRAQGLAVTGTVSNLADGSVEVVAEGDAARLEQFLSWLRKGPPGAFVRDVQVQWMPFTGGYTRFDVDF